ncbi:MAG: replication initiation factor domain-containing protein [Bacillota bacterium]|jgi:phage replication initiation protein
MKTCINKGENAVSTMQKAGTRKEKCIIATHENLTVKIDYISIVFDTAKAEDVIRYVLELPPDIFHVFPAKVKYKTYQTRWEIGDIYVSGNAQITEDNPQGLGCYLVMTGRGCDDVFRILDMHNHTFGDMFRLCEQRFGLDNFHFTRLDIAIDDKNDTPFFTIEQIKKKCEREEYISNNSSYRFNESKFDEFDTAKTVYIGAGKSGLSYRFYDKDKEVCMKYNKTLDEVGSWKRTEMQLRDEKAHVFAMILKDRPLELGELAFHLLAGNLRFVVPNKNESNKSRWKTCRFWERFLGAVEILKLHTVKPQNSLVETQQWLTTGGVISAVKGFYFLEEHGALGGLERVEDMLCKARYSTALASKLAGHLQRIDREELIPYIQCNTKQGKGGVL